MNRQSLHHETLGKTTITLSAVESEAAHQMSATYHGTDMASSIAIVLSTVEASAVEQSDSRYPQHITGLPVRWLY